jgi:hypothetical protein
VISSSKTTMATGMAHSSRPDERSLVPSIARQVQSGNL